MATWPGSPSQPWQPVTQTRRQGGPASPQPCSGEWERPGCALPTCLLEALPSINLPGSSGNHPISAWTTSQVTRSRCYDHPMRCCNRGCFCAQDKTVDRSVSGWTSDREQQEGWACLCQRSTPTVHRAYPTGVHGLVECGSPSITPGAQPCWPHPQCLGLRGPRPLSPSPIPLKTQSLLQTYPGSLTDAVSSARCPVAGGQDNKFCFVSKQTGEGGPLHGPQSGFGAASGPTGPSLPADPAWASGFLVDQAPTQPASPAEQGQSSAGQSCTIAFPLKFKDHSLSGPGPHWAGQPWPVPLGPGSPKSPQVDTSCLWMVEAQALIP